MDKNKKLDISIILTTFNENIYLEKLLDNLSKQNFNQDNFEVIILEAGDYLEQKAIEIVNGRIKNFRFISKYKLNRTKSLNELVKLSNGRLVIRLDGRSKIDSNYIKNIYNLSKKINAANVGGVKVPIGLSNIQKNIAALMSNPYSFGGGKFRNSNFCGYADTVYLGAFNKKLMPPQPWFDENNPKISEDSDLNYKIKKIGGKVYISSDIKVEYHARSSLTEFLKLCFNYGVGRGLFIVKNKNVSAPRQLILPIALTFFLIQIVIGLYNPVLLKTSAILFLSYIFFILIQTLLIKIKPKKIYSLIFFGFIGCHLFWVLGLFKGLLIYKK